MMPKFIKINKGFAILFSIVVAGILLSVGLGVVSIAFREVKFSSSAKDTNDAFFAADTGAECALYYDKPAPGPNRFAFTGTGTITCAGANVSPANPAVSGNSSAWSFSFSVLGLGNATQGCAKVVVSKTNLGATSINSKGYNVDDASCGGTNQARVERELKVNF